MPYPMRINQYLAQQKYSTRRGGDELVSQKKVYINGKLAKLGDKVNAFYFSADEGTAAVRCLARFEELVKAAAPKRRVA